jgi:hypothetical protein
MDLAQMSRAHLPWWLNIFLYILAEGAVSDILSSIPASVVDGWEKRTDVGPENEK